MKKIKFNKSLFIYSLFVAFGFIFIYSIASAFIGPPAGVVPTTNPSSVISISRGGTGLAGPGVSGNVLTSNGTAWVSSTPAATGVGGGGTVDKIPKFTASGTIGNSQLFDNGTRVGIGTETPDEKLHLSNGTLRIDAPTGTRNAIIIKQANTSWDTGIQFQTSTGSIIGSLEGNTNGNTMHFRDSLGVNALSINMASTSKLEIAGSIKIVDGNQGTNKVLTSDASGVGTWQAAGGGGPPAGTITMYGGNSASSGWLLADGSAVSRAIYSALFTAIGTTYGVGDGSTTFNLPNLKGKVPVGYDVAQTEFNALGKTGGEKTHILTIAEMPSHNHSLQGVTPLVAPHDSAGAWNPDGASASGGSTGSTGGGAAHNVLQPYITLNFIIKT